MTEELAALIEEQQRDMRYGDRVWSTSVDAFESGADIVYTRRRAQVTDTRHGTIYGYNRLLCRCAKCRAANAAYVRARRRRRPPVACVDCGTMTSGRVSPPRCQRCGMVAWNERRAA